MRPPVNRPIRPWYPAHPGFRPGYWWRWATVPAITGWVAYRWTTPIYYSYGSGGSVYYENNVVYVNGESYGTPEQYYNDTAQLATSVPETPADKIETPEDSEQWMPLGVFALSSESVNASNMYLQLALRKDGLIAGTFYNELTGTTHPLEGMVDEETQRAAWKSADGSNPNVIMETGIYNLTEDSAEVLIHFGPDQVQTALLVRLDESERPAALDSPE